MSFGGGPLDVIYNRYNIATTFLEDKLKAIRFHSLAMLRNLGHEVVQAEITPELTIVKDKKVTKKMTEEMALKMLLGEIDITDAISRRLKYVLSTDDFRQLDESQAAQVAAVVASDNNFAAFLSYRTFSTNTPKTIQNALKNSTDFDSHKITSHRAKLVHIVNLAAELNIKNVITADLSKEIKAAAKSKSNKTFTISPAIKSCFRIRTNKYDGQLSRLQAIQFLADCCSRVFSPLMNTARYHQGKNDIRFKNFNRAKIDNYDSLIKLRHEIREKCNNEWLDNGVSV